MFLTENSNQVFLPAVREHVNSLIQSIKSSSAILYKM